MYNVMKRVVEILSVCLFLSFLGVSTASADSAALFENGATQAPSDSSVMQAFTQHEDKKTGVVSVKEKTKRLVMFVMGVPLLLFILATAILGIAMGVYGKQVFVAHMICAGFSVTLAIAHAIVGLVWFFPF
jgi:hypothetical protein